MLGLCYVFGAIFAIWVLFYGFLELHYFLRSCLAVLLSRFCKKKVHILAETSVSGICLMTDVDTLLYHMNNARFIREVDFARLDFYERTGLYKLIRQRNGNVVLGATTIRYRRFIRLFSRFIINTKIIYWDSKSIFMEHRFVTPSNDFVNAIIICQNRLIDCDAEQVLQDMLVNTVVPDEESAKKQKPEIPLELQKWIESNEVSSAKLKSEAGLEVSAK